MKTIRAEFSDGKITVSFFPDDLVKHKIVSEFTPDGRPLSERVEYMYGIPAPVRDGRLLPLCFFEAVAAGAYKEAAAYLSPMLRQNISAGGEEEFFRGFFGDFLFAVPEANRETRLVYKKENGYDSKYFSAETANGFIVDFSDK